MSTTTERLQALQSARNLLNESKILHDQKYRAHKRPHHSSNRLTLRPWHGFEQGSTYSILSDDEDDGLSTVAKIAGPDAKRRKMEINKRQPAQSHRLEPHRVNTSQVRQPLNSHIKLANGIRPNTDRPPSNKAELPSQIKTDRGSSTQSTSDPQWRGAHPIPDVLISETQHQPEKSTQQSEFKSDFVKPLLQDRPLSQSFIPTDDIASNIPSASDSNNAFVEPFPTLLQNSGEDELLPDSVDDVSMSKMVHRMKAKVQVGEKSRNVEDSSDDESMDLESAMKAARKVDKKDDYSKVDKKQEELLSNTESSVFSLRASITDSRKATVPSATPSTSLLHADTTPGNKSGVVATMERMKRIFFGTQLSPAISSPITTRSETAKDEKDSAVETPDTIDRAKQPEFSDHTQEGSAFCQGKEQKAPSQAQHVETELETKQADVLASLTFTSQEELDERKLDWLRRRLDQSERPKARIIDDTAQIYSRSINKVAETHEVEKIKSLPSNAFNDTNKVESHLESLTRLAEQSNKEEVMHAKERNESLKRADLLRASISTSSSQLSSTVLPNGMEINDDNDRDKPKSAPRDDTLYDFAELSANRTKKKKPKHSNMPGYAESSSTVRAFQAALLCGSPSISNIGSPMRPAESPSNVPTHSNVNNEVGRSKSRHASKAPLNPRDVTAHDRILWQIRENGTSFEKLMPVYHARTGIQRSETYLKDRYKRLEATKSLYPRLLENTILKDSEPDCILSDTTSGGSSLTVPRKKPRNAQTAVGGPQSLSDVASQRSTMPSHHEMRASSLESQSIRPTTGGKIFTAAMVESMLIDAAEVFESEEEEAELRAEVEDKDERGDSPMTDADYLHFTYQVKRRTWAPGENEDEQDWFLIGDPETSLRKANLLAGREFAKNRGPILVQPCMEFRHHLDSLGQSNWYGSSERGHIRVTIGRELRNYHDGIIPSSKEGWLPKQCFTIQRMTTIFEAQDHPQIESGSHLESEAASPSKSMSEEDIIDLFGDEPQEQDENNSMPENVVFEEAGSTSSTQKEIEQDTTRLVKYITTEPVPGVFAVRDMANRAASLSFWSSRRRAIKPSRMRMDDISAEEKAIKVHLEELEEEDRNFSQSYEIDDRCVVVSVVETKLYGPRNM